MEDASAAFVGSNLLFGALIVAAARVLLTRRSNPMVWAYVGMTLLLVYGLPVQEYSKDVDTAVLLASHLLMFLYVVIVLLIASRRSVWLDEVIEYCTTVPGITIALVLIAWLVVRMYLFLRHGPAAFLFTRAAIQATDGLVSMSSLEMALSSITTLLLLGAFAGVTIRLAGGKGVVSPLITAALLMMLVLIIVANESPIGSRRLVLVLAMLWATVAWAHSGWSLPVWLWRRRRMVGLVGITLVLLTVYYQNVRQGDLLQDLVQARTPSEFAAGVFRFATALDGSGRTEEIAYVRSGPMDFLAAVVDAVLMDGKSSGGEATGLSLAISVPKALYPGAKPVADVDEVLLSYLAIYPDRPFLMIDYPTSLPAIAVADFGPLGVVPAALLFGLCLVAVGRVTRSVKKMPFAVLALLGIGVQLAGSQEAGLTSLVSALRDVGLLLFLVVVGRWGILTLRRSFKPSPHLPVHCVAQPLEAGKGRKL